MTGRKRDAVATRDAILASARQQFMQNGFDMAGVREIASGAGVNAALVNRYFGSKENLFDEAVLAAISLDALIEVERSEFGIRTAHYMATKTLGPGEFDPTLALIRSIGSPTVGRKLASAIETVVVAQLADWIGGEAAEQRAGLILSEIIGFDILRRIVGLESLAPSYADTIIHRLGAVVQSYVDHDDI